ncbi:MAG: hypothetical protein QW587_04865 [Candidatus Bathyarchaeia archaeon]
MADIIVLRAVFSNSDSQRDYYDPDRTLAEWRITELKAGRVTEALLRGALRLLPGWMQALRWTYRKRTASNHYYGQLRVEEGLGLTVRNEWGDRVGVGLILEPGYSRLNPELKPRPPRSLKALNRVIRLYEREAEERERKAREAQSRIMPELIRSATAILDEGGLRVLTRREKEDMARKYIV